MNLNTNEFFGMVKRKDVLGVLAYVLKENGEIEAAEEAKKTTRLTVAAVDRIREKMKAQKMVEDATEEKAEEKAEEMVEDATEEKAEEMVQDNEISNQFADLEKLISKGKKKKAKKLLTAMKESGLKGAELDKLEKQVKGL